MLLSNPDDRRDIPRDDAIDLGGVADSVVWRIPAGQRLLFEDFEDGIVMFDARVGSTHLLNVTAAEALAVVESEPGMTSDAIRARLIDRLSIDPAQLPVSAVGEMLTQLENLGIVAAETQ